MAQSGRGWEPYLSERDRQYLDLGLGKSKPFGLGSKPALLVIDVYYGAVGTEREPLLESVKRWPASCGLDGWEAIDRSVPVLAAARTQGVPVVYVKDFDERFPSPWARSGKARRTLSEEDQRAANQIVAELAPAENDLVLQKAAPSAFGGTPLEFHLTYLGVDTLLIIGESTSGCVRATAVDAATKRYRVGVVGDCCFDRTEASHFINLFDMDQKYADVIDSTAAVTYLEALDSARD